MVLLPAEISSETFCTITEQTLTSIEQIASKLAHSINVDPRDIHRYEKDARYDHIKAYPEYVQTSPDQALFLLRLASKAFHEVATRVLFRSHRAIWQIPDDSWSLDANTFNESLEKFLSGPINIGPMK